MPALLLVLCGCASVDTGPVPVEDRSRDVSIEDIEADQQSPASPVTGPAGPAAAGTRTAMPPAINALVHEADTMLASGQHETAAATLERAIRIDARNGVVWHKLARVKLVQGKLQQALTMARRSNSLSAQDTHLQLLNWRLILEVKEKVNDRTGINEARSRIESLETKLGVTDS